MSKAAWALALVALQGCFALRMRDAPPELVVIGVPDAPTEGKSFLLNVFAKYASRVEDVSQQATVVAQPEDGAEIDGRVVRPARPGLLHLRVAAVGRVYDVDLEVAAAPEPCMDPCAAAGATTCESGQIRTCEQGAGECLALGAAVACGSGACIDAAHCAACVDTCASVGIACVGGALTSCALDADGCLSLTTTPCAHGCTDGGCDPEIVAETAYPGDDSANAEAFAVAASAGAEAAIVTGYVTVASEGRNAWLMRATSAGSTWIFDPGLTATYNSGANSIDELYGVAIDGPGNIVVAGHAGADAFVRKYSPSLAVQWTKSDADFVAHGVALTAAGHVIAPLESALVCETQQLDTNSAGMKSWGSQWPGRANDACVDSNGSIFVAGALRIGARTDLIVRKLTNVGGLYWDRLYAGAGGLDDGAQAIACAPSGDVYVVGFESTANGGRDVCIRKYNTNGDTVWARRFDGPDHGSDAGNAIALDAAGNVIVTGAVTRGGGYDLFVRSYTPDGALRWTLFRDGAGYSAGNGLAVTALGRVLVVGSETRTSGVENALLLVAAP
ncbi:MAG: hypothetical protein IT381_13810 [Deltaproteobacteria bacterium]|nr:hypothetical protein [Deltaproteobacteria bacterium]